MNFYDVFMQMLADRKLLADNNTKIYCTIEEFNQAFQDTIKTLIEAEGGCCDGDCDCEQQQADGTSGDCYCEHGDSEESTGSEQSPLPLPVPPPIPPTKG